MIKRLPNWRLLSWWHRSAIVSGITLLFAMTMMLIGIATANSSAVSLQSKSQFCLSILPLILLIAIGTAARLQQRVNQRSGPIRQVGEG